MAETCHSTYSWGDDVLHCTLPAGHVEPTEEQPQGSPHEDSGKTDVLSGDPFRWWG